MKKTPRILALPNGSIMEPVLRLLRRVGITVLINGRQFLLPIRGLDLFDFVVFMRPQAIPEAVASGVVIAGLTGFDCLSESNLTNAVRVLVKLAFSKKSRLLTRIAVIGRTNRLVDTARTRVYAEFLNLAKRIFTKAQIIFSPGSSEVMVSLGVYDYAVVIIETGQTLIDNGLVIVREILTSPVVLIAKERTKELSLFGQILQGGLDSENYQLLKMNVRANNLQAVSKLLPAMESPTVNELADGSFQLETVLGRSEMADVLIKIKSAGAKDILAQDLNIVL
jgi:ATP phosphoribosyltransferase